MKSVSREGRRASGIASVPHARSAHECSTSTTAGEGHQRLLLLGIFRFPIPAIWIANC
jgi:hypothetical protein